jgi:hypothetical protein
MSLETSGALVNAASDHLVEANKAIRHAMREVATARNILAAVADVPGSRVQQDINTMVQISEEHLEKARDFLLPAQTRTHNFAWRILRGAYGTD